MLSTWYRRDDSSFRLCRVELFAKPSDTQSMNFGAAQTQEALANPAEQVESCCLCAHHAHLGKMGESNGEECQPRTHEHTSLANESMRTQTGRTASSLAQTPGTRSRTCQSDGFNRTNRRGIDPLNYISGQGSVRLAVTFGRQGVLGS